MGGFHFDLDAARMRAAKLTDYFSVGFVAMRFFEQPHLGTVAINDRYFVMVDYDAFKTWPVNTQASTLIHEVQHPILNHFERADLHGVPKDVFHRRLWGLAADYEINVMAMRDNRLTWPWEIAHPSQEQLPEDKIAEWYYDELVKRHHIIEIPIGGGDGDDQQDGDGQDGDGKEGEGDDPDGQKGNGTGHGKVMCGHCGAAANGDTRAEDEANLPDEQEGPSKFEQDMLRRKVAEAIKSSQSRGNVPLGWQRWADRILSPKLNYWAHIRNMVRGATTTLPGLDIRTYNRERRRPAIDPGMIFPATLRRVPRVGIYIDASGSMSEKQLGRAVSEVAGVLKSLGSGAKVQVFSGDTRIHKRQTVYTASQIQILGGGGTDVVDCINLMLNEKPKPDLVIAVTDGYTDWGHVKPMGNLFIINVGHGPKPSWPCKYVHIPEND